jgi:hypothetical protein
LKIKRALAAAILLSSGCAGYAVRTTRNGDGTILVSMSGDRLVERSPNADYDLALNASRYENKDGSFFYSLTTIYEGSKKLFVGPGQSLVLTVDGRPIALSGDGSARFREAVGPEVVRERAQYEISPDVLRRLANAKAVSVRLTGERRAVETSLSEQNMKNFRSFASDYVR